MTGPRFDSTLPRQTFMLCGLDEHGGGGVGPETRAQSDSGSDDSDSDRSESERNLPTQ